MSYPAAWGSEVTPVHSTLPSSEPAPTTSVDPGVVSGERKAVQDVPRDPEGHEDPVTPLASSLFSSDEVVAGTSASGPSPIDSRAHQDLLRRVVRNMDLLAEEVVEPEEPMVDILALEGPSRVALPLIKTIQANTKTLWQTLASIPPTARESRGGILSLLRDMNILTYTRSPAHWWWPQ